MEVVSFSFITLHPFSIIVQPCKEALYAPSVLVMTQGPSILRSWLSSVPFVQWNKLNTFSSKPLVQRITINRPGLPPPALFWSCWTFLWWFAPAVYFQRQQIPGWVGEQYPDDGIHHLPRITPWPPLPILSAPCLWNKGLQYHPIPVA